MMASDTEDLELESLRSAVLASLKPKQQPQNEVTKTGASSDNPPAAAEEEDDEESLRLLRLAALKSKKEDSVLTPVTGSPARPTYHPPQPVPFQQTGVRSNLITIPLQDTSAPSQPVTTLNSHQGPGKKVVEEDSENKEERSTKFSRFESSDSESDYDEDILLQTTSDSEKSHFSASESDKEEESDADSWRTRSFSEAESSASEAEAEVDIDRKSPESVGKNSDASENAEKDAIGEKEMVSDKSHHPRQEKEEKSAHVIRKDNAKESRDSERRNRRDRGRELTHSDLRSRLGNKEQERIRDRDHRNTRDKRDDNRRRDSEREKRLDERRRQYEARRGERRQSRERSQRQTSDRPRRADRTNSSIDKRALEARRQKFASGSSVNLKDGKVTLKTLKTSENGAHIPNDKSKILDSDLNKKESQTSLEGEKLPTEEVESDISLSSSESESESESEAESESESDSEDGDKKESESESESGSDEEITRFKRTSTKSDTKTSSQAPTQSRLITSMTFPKEGPPALLPRRRPMDNDRSRDRRGLDDMERSRRPPGSRDWGRERDRRDHLPRHLDQQERSLSRESRDRLRLDTRESRRHPRNANVNDKLGEKDPDKRRKPDVNERERDIRRNLRDIETNDRVPNADSTRRNPRDSNFDEKRNRVVQRDESRALSRKIPTAKDFVSESSESESETANQALRSIVKTDKPDEDSKINFRDSDKLHRSKNRDRDELKQRDSKKDRERKERRSRHKRDVKERIGRRKEGVREQEKMSHDEAVRLDSFRVTVSEDPAAQKKRSVLDRLGSAPPADKVRNSVKSRLGPVKTEAADSTTNIAPIDPEDDFFPDENLGPHGDGVKRRKVEINDLHSNPAKKRLKLKRVEHSEIKFDELEVDSVHDKYAAEPVVKRKQLSKSLLSRLSDKPSTPLDSEDTSTPLEGGSSPDIEPVKRKVKSRDDDDDDDRVEKKKKSKIRDVWSSRRKEDASKDENEDDVLSKKVRKSKNKDMWTSKRSVVTSEPKRDDDEDEAFPVKKERRSRDVWSSKRKAVAMEIENDSKGSKDDDLEEKIKMIKAKNAAILRRQREIEEEKKMFGGHR